MAQPHNAMSPGHLQTKVGGAVPAEGVLSVANLSIVEPEPENIRRSHAFLRAFLFLGIPGAFLLTVGVPSRIVYPVLVGLALTFFFFHDRLFHSASEQERAVHPRESIVRPRS